jgi:adenylate cyclase
MTPLRGLALRRDRRVPLFPGIRFGTERYPEKVARRLRTLNFTTWITAGIHATYVLILIFVPALHWLALTNAVAMLLYAAVPLLHRLSPLAAPVAVTILVDVDLSMYMCLIGTGIGIQFYYLVGAALLALYIGAEYVGLLAASGAIAAALIVILQFTVPHDTGLLPAWVFDASVVVNAFASSGLLLVIVSYALRQAVRAEAVAEREFERSERLLSNILPPSIADRLKSESNTIIADRYDEASVLFADMAGFTARAGETAPDELVQFLNRVFSDFDRLVERHGLEKIKTTGDAYMVISGVPAARGDHAQALATLALEMRETAREWRDPHGRSVPVRIGISSGPVVAGVVGTRKFFYDVWGDAVNVAARMETTGVAGKIQISQSVYERLKDDFVLDARGEIEVKGKGSMQTWFLVGRKPPADARTLPDRPLEAPG